MVADGFLSMPAISPIVFVVDDDISIRESFERLLRHEGWRTAATTSAGDFLDRPAYLVPNGPRLDAPRPAIRGLESQRQMAKGFGDMPIIFISGHGDVLMTVGTMKGGAIDFFTKPLANDALLSAIRQALDHSFGTLTEQMEIQELSERYATLSQREREVMALVVSGLPNKQVAAELGIREITVKVHRGRVMRKMKASSLANLVQIATKLSVKRPAWSLSQLANG
jgi:FixJ family two-component response regulator